MPNILIIADIHVDDYPRCNPTSKFRLNQFKLLARRVDEIAKNEDCKEIWIAGDFLNKPVNVPKPNNIAQQMSELWAKRCKVRYIRGQHDTFGKVDMKDPENSNLYMFHNSMEYMDHKIIELSGHTFAFMDWSKKQDLSWIKDKVNVMIGHLSFGFGQDWDRTKFDIGFFGDIHKEFIDKNIVSIGNPIQHDMNSQSDGSVIILNTRTLDWKRVKVDPDHSRFLRMIYTEEGLGYDGKLTWELRKHKKVKIKSAKEAIKLEDLSFNELLDLNIKKNNLEEVHKKVLSEAEAYVPVNFNFKIKSIHIHNIKGIHDLTTSIDSNLMIVGRNGSGKTSFIISLYQLLTGAMDWDQIQRRGKSPGFVEGEILYEGKSYYIKRSEKSNHLKIDGVEITYKDKLDFPKIVAKHLPFTKYYKAYYFNYWVRELLRPENNSILFAIITRFNGLDIFSNLSKSVNKLLDAESSKFKEYQTEINTYKSLIESRASKIKSIRIPEDFDPSLLGIYQLIVDTVKLLNSTKSLRDRVEKLRKLTEGLDGSTLSKELTEAKSKRLELDEFIKNYEILKREGKELSDKIEELNQSLKEISVAKVCILCGHELDEEHRIAEQNRLKGEISKLTELYNPKWTKFQSMREGIKDKKSELESLPDKIESLADKLHDLRNYLELKDQVINSVKIDERIIIGTDEFDLDRSIEVLEDYKSNLNQYNKLIELKSEKDEYSSKLENLRIKRDESKELIEKYKLYQSLVSKDGSIFESILRNLADKLSNETFKFRVRVVEERKQKVTYITVKYFDQTDQEWKEYYDCSQGQKSLCDTYFLYKLLNGCGLIVFDEYYSHVDDDNLQDIADFLNNMDVGAILLSTHSYNCPLQSNVLNFPIAEQA